MSSRGKSHGRGDDLQALKTFMKFLLLGKAKESVLGGG